MSSLLRAVRCMSRSAIPAVRPAIRIAPRRLSVSLGAAVPVASAIAACLRSRLSPMGAAATFVARFSSGHASAAGPSSSSSASPSASAPIRLALIGDAASSKSALLTALQSRSTPTAAALHPSEHDVLWELDSGEEVVARRRRLDLSLGASQLQLLDYSSTEEATKAVLGCAATRTGRGEKDKRTDETMHGALLVIDASNATKELSPQLRTLISMLPRHWPLLVLLNQTPAVEGTDAAAPSASPTSIESLVSSLRSTTNGGDSITRSGTREPRPVQPVVIKARTTAESDAKPNIDELLQALSAAFPVSSAAATPPHKEPFLMAAGSIHSASLAVTPLDAAPLDAAPASLYTEVSNYPSVLKGRLQLGSVCEGQTVELVGRKGARWESVVQRVNAEEDSVTLAGALDRPMVSEGVHYLVSPPHSLPLRSSFEAHLFALAPWEGGRYVPLMQGSSCDVRFSAEDLPAGVAMLDQPPEIVWGTANSAVDWICPGSALTVRIYLAAPTPLRAGMPLTIRQGNQPVAFGIVARTNDQPSLNPLPEMSTSTRISQGVYTLVSLGDRYIGWWLSPLIERLGPMEFWIPAAVLIVVLFLD